MAGQLCPLLYFFYQAELFPDYKTHRLALSRDVSRGHFVKSW